MKLTKDRIFKREEKHESRTHHGILVVEEGGVLPQLPLDAGEVAGARKTVDGLGFDRPRPRPPVLAPRHPLPPPPVNLHLRVCARASALRVSESVRRSRRGRRKGGDGEAVKRNGGDGTSAFAVIGLLKIVAFLALIFFLFMLVFFLFFIFGMYPGLSCFIFCARKEYFLCCFLFFTCKSIC